MNMGTSPLYEEVLRLRERLAAAEARADIYHAYSNRWQARAVEAEDQWETRNDVKRVRKDRWETGIRNIVSILIGNGTEFEIPEIVERVRALSTAVRAVTDDPRVKDLEDALSDAAMSLDVASRWANTPAHLEEPQRVDELKPWLVSRAREAHRALVAK